MENLDKMSEINKKEGKEFINENEDEFNGIINYLRKQSNGQIEISILMLNNIVNISKYYIRKINILKNLL